MLTACPARGAFPTLPSACFPALSFVLPSDGNPSVRVDVKYTWEVEEGNPGVLFQPRDPHLLEPVGESGSVC